MWLIQTLTVSHSCNLFRSTEGLKQASPWSTGRWWCTWRLVVSFHVSVDGSWCAPLFQQSTGPSLKWEASYSPPPTTTPTCGGTVSLTPRGCLTARTTPPCWHCLVGYLRNTIVWYKIKKFSWFVQCTSFVLAFLHACRALAVSSVITGFFGGVLTLIGMKCTKIGGSELANARVTFAGAVTYLVSGKSIF